MLQLPTQFGLARPFQFENINDFVLQGRGGVTLTRLLLTCQMLPLSYVNVYDLPDGVSFDTQFLDRPQVGPFENKFSCGVDFNCHVFISGLGGDVIFQISENSNHKCGFYGGCQKQPRGDVRFNPGGRGYF